MITLKDLKIYKSYDGNSDMYLRIGYPTKESTDTFCLIDSLVQDLILIENGNASPGYAESVYNRLRCSCEDTETAEELKGMGRYFRDELLNKVRNPKAKGW